MVNIDFAKKRRQLYSSKPSGNGCGLVVIDDEFSGGTSSAD